ncbi:cytochrome c biogenesis protein ResB [Pandoraea bronchicola]|uniref:Cytochrome C biogenesis protein ResB n=1 Tax=Pandoraea bronchicola TaxID=2508287 RepID=A0A5E5BX98_9BURK|nr:cytochrome c biogenesis protein ResB [Pandoraea bronchicola]VVE89946.1 cytochrome C biogenesis protein ResB [Pandoraea bronchicola]
MSISTSGMQIKGAQRWVRDGVELVSSMRFAISLLTVLAIASIVGTVLKQGDPYPNYVNQFGPFWAGVFRSLGLYTVYSSWWFLLILFFLMASTTLCIVRNGPKMIADIRSWRDHVREGSLRAFGHKAEFTGPASRGELLPRLTGYLGHRGYRFVVRERDGATLVAAKAGAINKIGYIFAHSAIVIICLGGLVDSDLLIRVQMALFGKSPLQGNAVIAQIPPTHRLSPNNPAFRGYAFVPEGGKSTTAILNFQDGSVVQDLPFAIELKKFHVDYYSTGMPKLFASDIAVTDPETGKTMDATVKVNEPFIFKGVAIYQSSFEDGGSKLKLTGYPMHGASDRPFAFSGDVGGSTQLRGGAAGKDEYTVEFSDFRAINVENISNGGGERDVRGVARKSLRDDLSAQLGSGARTDLSKDLRNVGPSVQYKLRDRSGQAKEYRNYMLPILVDDGERVFMTGVRDTPDGPFQYLRIPADADGSVKQWMLLRAALQDDGARAEAARRFAAQSLPAQTSTALRAQLQESAKRELDLFAGVIPASKTSQTKGGLQAIAEFVNEKVPQEQQSSAADMFRRILDGTVWQLWQVAREQAGQPAMTPSPENERFVHTATNALSDNFLYDAPVFLQLDSFEQIQASVFQLTRSPGKKIVYLGSLLLVLGIFSMFYVRERRLWMWLKDTPDGGSSVLMAVSTTRRTLDFEKEFARTKAEMDEIVTKR